MQISPSTATHPGRRSEATAHVPRADPLGAVAGIAFVVLLFISVAMVDPQRGVTDDELLTWWANSGNRDGFVISMYTLLAACPLFLLFLSRLRLRLRTAAANGWADFAFAAGIVATAALGICAVTRGVVASAMRFQDEPLPGVDTLRFATNLAYEAWNLTILFAAVVIASVSVLAIVNRALPRWLGWLGVPVAIGCAIALAAQAAPLALPLLNVWVIATCVHLTRRPIAAVEQQPMWQPEVSAGQS